MKITARDLSIHADTIFIGSQEVTAEVDDTFTTFDQMFNEVEKTMVLFSGRQDSWYCPADQIIELDEYGRGRIELTEGDAFDFYVDVTLDIEVKVSVPLTAEILLKKRIGIL